MAQPSVIAVSADALELCQSAKGKSRKGVSIALDDAQTEPIFIGFNGLKGLTKLTGFPIYPGQGIIFLADSNEFHSAAASSIGAIADVGPVSVRVQEIE